MSKNVVARLRELIRNDGMITPTAVMVDVPHLTAMLDIVEAVAENGTRLGEYDHCQYCGTETVVKTRYHAPGCPYIRARELCGKDGAS